MNYCRFFLGRFFAGATVATVLTIASPAHAGLLGGNASGAANGTLSGQMGGIDGAAAGRATGSIGAQTDAVGRVGNRTRDIGERAKGRVKDTAATARDTTHETVERAHDTTVDAAATATGSVSATADQAVNAAGSVNATANSTADAMGSAASSAQVPNSEPAKVPANDGILASGDVSQSIGANKSIEAGDRTVDAMAESSTQGAARAEGDSDSLSIDGNGTSQSAASVKSARKSPAASTPAATESDTLGDYDRR